MLQMDYDRKHNKPVNEKEYESVQKELKNLSDIYDRTVIKAFSEMYAEENAIKKKGNYVAIQHSIY